MEKYKNNNRMKKSIKLSMVVAVLMFSTLAMTSNNTVPKSEPIQSTATTPYCEGWEDGYCEGWKDVKGSLAICPITPLCPLPEAFKDRYRDGYHRGFRKGAADARRANY